MDREVKTIPLLLKQRVDKTPEDIAYMEKDASGKWQKITWRKFYDRVVSFASGFIKYHLEPSDQIAILLPNCIMWEVAQQAAYHAGCVVVGLDRNDPIERIRQIIELSDIKVVVVQSFDQFENLPHAWLKTMKLILVVDYTNPSDLYPQAMDIERLMVSSDDGCLPLIEGVHPATVLFTSGTTGKPKAISYDHDQVVAAVQAITRQMSDVPEQASSACWLPLSNPFQRIANLCSIQKSWTAYMVPDPGNIILEITEIKPHFFAAVPRFYEKIYDGIQQKIKEMPVVLRYGMMMALKIGMAYQSLVRSKSVFSLLLKIPNKIVDTLFFKNIRQIFGGNVRYFISGSAPMSLDLLKRFSAMGWSILESYGVSENIVPMSMSTLNENCMGTVGKPLVENIIKIADDGEVLVRGIGVARLGVDLTEDGYLRTGDLGRIDKAGYLKLSGRKADSFKLSTGRKIVPMMIESALKQIDEVSHAVIDGANQKYVMALLNIEKEDWENLIERFQSLSQIHTYLEQQIAQACKKLPYYCRPVDFVVVCKSFSVETGELTGNLKLRRKYILHQYNKAVLNLYQNREKLHPNTIENGNRTFVLNETT